MKNTTFRFFVTLLMLSSLYITTMAQSSGFDVNRMDKTVEACTDFFQYANGTWLKNTEIPPAYSRWGTFNVLAENNRDILKTVVEKASKEKAAAGSDAQLIGDFYASCLNEAAIEKASVKPLKPYFKQIGKIKTKEDLVKQIAMLHNAGISALFGFGGGPDLKDSNMVIANTGQGGLSLPNSEYYTKTDEKSVETRAKFVEYMTKMFTLLGDKPDKAAMNAKTVMDMQTRLAKASLPPVEMRNPDNRYHKMSLEEAGKITPNISWSMYIAARKAPTVTEINIGQPAFFSEVNKMMDDVSIKDWQTYLRWMTINDAADVLSSKFEQAKFEFFGKYLNGQKEMQPRWRRCVAATDGSVGEALGQEFVKTAFTPEAKKRMNSLIDNLFAAMKVRINNLEWMSPETKVEAQRKLSTFARKIGFPDVLRGYKGLSLSRRSYFENAYNSGQFQIGRNLQDIGKPVDRTRWGMTSPTVNAYYNGTFNEIVFPAGILQPPFFNPNADDAINYGAIGGVIGHEISHGFDDQGSKFDADGNFKSWWTPQDREKFDARAMCVVKQFDGYEVQPGLNMNGKLTLGENIGDFAGLTIAYDAFQKAMADGKRQGEIDGFTPEQRFFLGWAQVWAAKSTTEAERSQVLGDPHALPKWRVNGPMSNMPQFAKAFGCKSGDKMVREDMCEIW